MLKGLFAPLAMKIAGGIIAALLIALALVWLAKEGEERHARKLQSALSECEAMRAVQNAAVEAMKAEGDKLRAQVDAARSQGEREMDKARDVKERLSNLAPIGCATPRVILEADI